MPSIAPPNPEELKRVEVYFQGKSSYWRDVYGGGDLEGTIYRDRMALTLRWIDELALPSEARALEEGCGAGLTTVALAQRSFRVDAMDTAQAMVELTRQCAAENGVEGRVRVHVGDAHQLSLEDNSFRLVLALGLLPWLPQPQAAVKEMARVLHPGGYLLATADNRWCLNHVLDPGLNPAFSLARRAWHKLRRVMASAPAGPGGSAPVARAYRHSAGEVEGWLASVGLRKVKSATVGFGPFTLFGHEILSEPTGLEMHRRLQKLADRNLAGIRSAGWHYLVLAQKPGRDAARPAAD